MDKLKTTKGSRLVIWITGTIGEYIAEVTEESPLQLKVEEYGPYAHLKDGDFIIRPKKTVELQDENHRNDLLQRALDTGKPLMSGLESLGATDGRLRPILPSN